jgi:Uma2 family endonuclease
LDSVPFFIGGGTPMATLTAEQAKITERRPAVAEEVLRSRKDDMPWEIHDGELIETSPSGYRHLRIISRILRIFFAFVGSRTDIEVLGDGGDSFSSVIPILC